MNEKLERIHNENRLCDICKFRLKCYEEDWPHGDEYPPCAVQMPEDWIDYALVDKVYNAILQEEQNGRP